MYEFSVEQAANKIYDYRTKDYFREVMNNYFNGNHRSALVMLWTVVICDLIYKLQYLNDIHGDEKAKAILDEVADFQAKNPANPKWEENLLKEIHTRTNLIEAHEFDSLQSLHRHRHLSAHPVIKKTNILFRPYREMVLSDIRLALDAVLTKPPILTKQVFGELVSDLERVKDLFADNGQLERYLESRYFNNLNEEVSMQIFKSLWRVTFKIEDEKCKENRIINSRAIRILFDRNRETLTSYIKNNSPYFSEISDGDALRHAVFFLGDYPHLYDLLSGATKEVLFAKAKSDIDLLAVSYFVSKNINEHINMLIKYIEDNHKCCFGGKFDINVNHIKDLTRHAESAGIKYRTNKLLITMYVNANDFDAADSLFSKYIRPNISNFNREDIENLIEGISNNNQTHWRGKAESDHKLVVKRAKEVIDDFDSSSYRYLPDEGVDE